jgi:hypothetical protein
MTAAADPAFEALYNLNMLVAVCSVQHNNFIMKEKGTLS